MKIGLNLDTFGEKTLDELIPICKQLDISNVEIWASNLIKTDNSFHPRSYSGKDLTLTKKMLRDSNVYASAVSFGFGLDAEYCKDSDLYSAELIKTIEAAHYLESPYVIFHIRDIRRQFNLDIKILEPYISDALKRAEELNITLLLENQAMDMTCCPENVLELLKAFSSECFQYNFDPANCYLAANEPFPYAYEMLKPYIKNIHIKNLQRYEPAYCPSDTLIGLSMTRAFEGQKAYRVNLSEGVLNNEGFLKKLHKDGYKGVVSLENHGTFEEMLEMCSTDAKYLRDTGYFES